MVVFVFVCMLWVCVVEKVSRVISVMIMMFSVIYKWVVMFRWLFGMVDEEMGDDVLFILEFCV